MNESFQCKNLCQVTAGGCLCLIGSEGIKFDQLSRKKSILNCWKMLYKFHVSSILKPLSCKEPTYEIWLRISRRRQDARCQRWRSNFQSACIWGAAGPICWLEQELALFQVIDVQSLDENRKNLTLESKLSPKANTPNTPQDRLNSRNATQSPYSEIHTTLNEVLRH